MIKCIVFDFDGVLVDSNAVKRSAYFDIFAPLGVTRPVVEAALEANRDGDRYQIIERVLHQLGVAGFLTTGDQIGELTKRYAEQYNHICEEHAATCPEIAGTSVCLPQLAMCYVLYVNSATPEEPLRRIIHRRGWENYFKDILGRPRTKAENLAHILEREMISGVEAVFVGDNQIDLDAAIQCGCQFVGMVHNTSQFESALLRSVRDLSELTAIINQLNRR
jgi:phosphoglycolate phosphatase-like HAD superfamily hydrolase